MAKSDKARRAIIGIAVYEQCSAWIASGLLELFAIANTAQRIAGDGRSRCIEFECQAIARRGRTVRGPHGVSFAAGATRRRYDAVIVPPIWCQSIAELQERAEGLRSHEAWLHDLARRSGIMASACSGAVLLANAGLLDGYRATTCWWLAPWFERRFSNIELAPDRLVVTDRNRWTAAAGSAYIHLGLELVRELAGEKAAAVTARLMLVERRRGSQSPFLATTVPPVSDGRDPLIERALRYMDAHAGSKVSVADICGHLAVTERTLMRKFRLALDLTPLEYLQSRRIARSRELLEGTQLPLDAIVEQCGYQDVSSFRKLFARQVGMTPREYRSRFGASQRG